jgi:hypothetical protein
VVGRAEALAELVELILAVERPHPVLVVRQASG